MRLAIFGGTFNPVHNAHVALAAEVRAKLGYDRIALIPANLPPHKELSGGATAEDRLAMLYLVAEGSPYLTVETCELDRGGLSFTIDTLSYLESAYAGQLEGKIGLIIGQDLVAGFEKWREAARIAAKADIILARRPSASLEAFPYACTELENSLSEVSSSLIREAIAGSKSWRSLVPDPVYRYIVEHHLYE